MRVVFFGTPEPAARALDALVGSPHEVVALVTQPDRPRGRSGKPQPPAAKVRAEASSIPVLQPSSPRDPGFAEAFASYAPDAGAVVAYGHLLPPDLLAVPRRGFVNVHFSLLPRYRGAAPVQRAIMAGETETGVTTFLLEPTFDTGPILQQVRVHIAADDTGGTLLDRLSERGARLLLDTLDAIESGTIRPMEQDPALASPAPKVRPEEGAVDWSWPAASIVNLIRALNPSPGAYSAFRGKRIKLWRGRAIEPDGPAAQPGTIVATGKERFVVSSGRGGVQLEELQIEGGKRLRGSEFLRGHRPEPGEVLGTMDAPSPHG